MQLFKPANYGRPSSVMIYPHSYETMTGQAAREILTSSWVSATWPSNNLAIYIPFTLEAPFLVAYLGWFNGATVSGNVDVGVFDDAGVKLVSTGSTAQATVSVLQQVNVADLWIGPGRYYLGMSSSTTVATFQIVTAATAGQLQMLGLAQQAAALPLPATATFASMAQVTLPWCYASQRSMT